MQIVHVMSFSSHKEQPESQAFLPLKVIAFLSAAIDLSVFWKTFLGKKKKKNICTECAKFAFLQHCC